MQFGVNLLSSDILNHSMGCEMIKRYQVELNGVEGSILRYSVLLVSIYFEWLLL